MKKLLKPIHMLALIAAGLFTATLTPAQSIWNVSSGNWSTAANWSPSGVPGLSSNVMFTNNAGAASSAGTVDNTVDSGFAGPISALQYANTNNSNGAGYYHTTQIAAGQTLTVANGLTVGTLGDAGGNAVVNATISGAGAKLAVTGGSMVVNQASATSGTHFGFLNMTNLDTFTANIGRLQIGIANGVNRAEGILYLAKTNVITFSGSAPQLYMGYNNGNNDGSAEYPILYLGLTNMFFVDSITMSADKQGNPASRVLFNPVFTNNNPVAYFRGITGSTSRVSSWILGNNGAQTTTGSTSDCTNDYSYGTLDAMVNTMTLGISEKAGATGSGNGNGTFTFTAGTNNVNTLILGESLGNSGASVGNGSMNVNGSNAVLIVNSAICLSYWTSPGAYYGAGNLNINGGTVMANTITNGVTVPGSLGSVNANITMNGGTLGITGLLGSAGTTAWPLGIITFNNSILQLAVSGLQTNVVADVVNANGISNIINITSVPASVITYPTVVPLISYSVLNLGGGFNFAISNLPAAYQGFISNDTANSSVDLVLTSGPTSVPLLKWNGSVSANWDTTTLNWLNGATAAIYTNGDAALFDDTATTSAVNLPAAVPPASVTVSNSILNYSFAGAGIGGLSSLTKYGAGSLLFTNSGNTFIGNITINAGTVQFGNGGTSGNLPPTGSVLNNGSLIINHSSADVVPNTISGTGTVTKNGTGAMTMTASNTYSGVTVVNAGTLLVNGINAGILTNAAGSTLGGNGTNLGTVYVSGAIQPSAVSGIPSTFTSGGDLDLSVGATLKFNLNGNDNTEGSGINDLLELGGNFNANNNAVAVNFLGVPQTGVAYTIVNFPNGSQSGTLNPTVTGTHYTVALNQAGTTETVTLSGSGANLAWDATASTAWDVGTSTNWLNQGTSLLDFFYAGDNVLFDELVAGVSTNVTVATGVAVYPATITVNVTNKIFSIAGPGKISGAASIQKNGPGTLILSSGANDFTGNIQVNGGLLKSGANSSLGKGNTYINLGATLDLNATAMGGSVYVGGAGVGGNGAIVNNGFIVNGDQNAFDTGTTIYVQSNTVFGCNNRWDIRNGSLLSGGGGTWNMAIKGSNGVYLVNATVDDALGSVDIQSGTFAIQTTTLANSGSWAGNPAHTNIVESGATLELDASAATALGQTLSLSNNAVLQNDGTICALSGPVTLSGMVTINNLGSVMTESGVINGTGGFTKLGSSTLTLTANAVYSGSTLVSAGTLQLGQTGVGDGSISDSTNIIIAAGAVIDASQRSDLTLALTSGQTLQGNGTINGMLTVGSGAALSAGTNASITGTLTITNTVTLLGNTLMKINVSGATNDVINDATNGATINLGGTLTVTNVSATAYAAGNSFRLFNAAVYSGGFSSIVPATPGTGLVWNTNNLANGILAVASGVVPQPGITSVSLSGTNLVIMGTNGLAGEQYNVVMTTNLTVPLTNWTVLPTNTFIAGPFSITNGLNPNAPQGFYRIRVP